MTRRPAARRYFFSAFIAGLLACFPAIDAVRAAQVSIRPLGVVLSGERSVETFTVTNPGNRPVTLQAETLSWGQDDGENLLDPTREILVTPPIFSVPPSGSQLVRVGLRRAPDPVVEMSYRVLFSEVPPPPEPGFTGLVVALRISIPVFVRPPQPVSADVKWRASMREGSGELHLQATNLGNAHFKLNGVDVLAGNAEIGTVQSLKYVLPQGSASLTVPVSQNAASGTMLQLQAQTSAGRRSYSVRVD